jgi:predicted nucleotidyltransferase
MIARNLELPAKGIAAFCGKWKVRELSLFGSVLRDDFGPDSDVDVLVEFAPGAAWTFPELIEMEAELARLVGRRVDLVERRSVERSENYIRRREILRTAESVYVTR